MEESSTDINIFNRKPSNSTKQPVNETVVEQNAKHNYAVPIESSGRSYDDFYYNMSGDKYLYIFNHYEYESSRYFIKKPSTRIGTDKDVVVLKTVFGDLGFKVIIYNDCKYDQIHDAVTSITKQDHSRTSCVCLVFMTHGDRGGVVYAADRPYEFREITRKFESPSSDPGLIDKPKLFFIQACRGENFDEGRLIETDGGENDAISVPTHIDFLILYSTIEDFVSWRDTNGSWLIQELCRAIKEFGRERDILQIITITNSRVARERASYTRRKSTNNKKQMPETHFTLTKLLYF